MTMERPNQPVVTPASIRPHGALPRGLAMDTRSRLFEGRFGRLFRALPPADFGASDAEAESLLETLARAMIHEVDCPKDGEDDEEPDKDEPEDEEEDDEDELPPGPGTADELPGN